MSDVKAVLTIFFVCFGILANSSLGRSKQNPTTLEITHPVGRDLSIGVWTYNSTIGF